MYFFLFSFFFPHEQTRRAEKQSQIRTNPSSISPSLNEITFSTMRACKYQCIGRRDLRRCRRWPEVVVIVEDRSTFKLLSPNPYRGSNQSSRSVYIYIYMYRLYIYIIISVGYDVARMCLYRYISRVETKRSVGVILAWTLLQQKTPFLIKRRAIKQIER